VLAAIYLRIEKNRVAEVRVAFGGMAAIPKRAVACEQALLKQAWQQSTIDAAKQALTVDFAPMSDVRASSEYRMKVAQNLLQKCFIELQQRNIETRVTNYA
jgi:xanthine dehydrogenase small subunit